MWAGICIVRYILPKPVAFQGTLSQSITYAQHYVTQDWYTKDMSDMTLMARNRMENNYRGTSVSSFSQVCV